jgi:hypothetical protein
MLHGVPAFNRRLEVVQSHFNIFNTKHFAGDCLETQMSTRRIFGTTNSAISNLGTSLSTLPHVMRLCIVLRRVLRLCSVSVGHETWGGGRTNGGSCNSLYTVKFGTIAGDSAEKLCRLHTEKNCE